MSAYHINPDTAQRMMVGRMTDDNPKQLDDLFIGWLQDLGYTEFGIHIAYGAYIKLTNRGAKALPELTYTERAIIAPLCRQLEEAA